MASTRTRLSPQERRRQLIGIGLRAFVDHPVQEVSLDAVAAEAGVSRGLLFHYFPTKTDFHTAVAQAGVRRVLRTITPDEDAKGAEALRQVVTRFVAQVDRRRAPYLAFVHGQGVLRLSEEDPSSTFRGRVADLVAGILDATDAQRPLIHAWVALLEDLALQATGSEATLTTDDAVAAALAAIRALL